MIKSSASKFAFLLIPVSIILIVFFVILLKPRIKTAQFDRAMSRLKYYVDNKDFMDPSTKKSVQKEIIDEFTVLIETHKYSDEATKARKQLAKAFEIFSRPREAIDWYLRYIKHEKNSTYTEEALYRAITIAEGIPLEDEEILKLYTKFVKEHPYSTKHHMARYKQIELRLKMPWKYKPEGIIRYSNEFLEKCQQSEYRDEVMFIMAQKYLQINQKEKAIEIYDKIINDFDDVNILIKAALNKRSVKTGSEEKLLDTTFSKICLRIAEKIKKIFKLPAATGENGGGGN